ncbi:MAG: hypothetical protein HY532_02265 [Chloroflexi bacterium]|nr:hypothetical protein [Chloroflexota bacterium]
MSITVVPAYRVVKRFLKDVEGMPTDAALDSLWGNLRTYMQHMLSASDAPFADLGQRMAVSQIGDPSLADLAKGLDDIEAGHPKELVEDTLARCAEALPRPDLSARVLLLPGDGQSRVMVSQMHGAFGVSLGSSATLLFLWPSERWQQWLCYTIAHEYAHLVRNLLLPRRMTGGKLVYQKTQEPETLLDAMVAEGIADAFAMRLFPGMAPASYSALEAETEAKVWPKVRRRLGVSDTSEIRRMLFGDNDRIPAWTGHTIGHRMVQDYLNLHPTARPAGLTGLVGLHAKVIFEATQYHPRLTPV